MQAIKLTLLGALLLITGCASLPPTPVPELATPSRALPANALPDVNIVTFDPGLSSGEFVYPQVRKTEARVVPAKLARVLQNTAAWGAIRVVPSKQQRADLMVYGKIVESDGERLRLHIRAVDAAGNTWLDKNYRGVADANSYLPTASKDEPFRAVYHQVANDLLKAQNRHSEQDLAKLRLINDMRFARSFSPAAFNRFLSRDSRGRYHLQSLPALNDPMLKRMRRLRERDNLFVDTLQGHYNNFESEVDRHYQEWRSQSFKERQALRQLRAQGTAQMIGGLAAIVGGISAAGSSNPRTRSTSNAAILIGSQVLMRGMQTRGEASTHAQALEELGNSLNAELAPQVISFDEHTVTLTGSVEEQYAQWRELLAQLYAEEMGIVVSEQD